MDWLAFEQVKGKLKGEPVDLNIDNKAANYVMHLLGGELDWSNIEGVFEYLEIIDYDTAISCLVNLKESRDKMRAVQQ